jgi:hypothetical protein
MWIAQLYGQADPQWLQVDLGQSYNLTHACRVPKVLHLR